MGGKLENNPTHHYQNRIVRDPNFMQSHSSLDSIYRAQDANHLHFHIVPSPQGNNSSKLCHTGNNNKGILIPNIEIAYTQIYFTNQ
ncbi:hypothetical protein E2C01_015033 [Portunus trituberculatus]|uniref:Tyrosinase copper-binding domain-containing protein n=1 Tax=Portunus trituberculatus TaxID=210409 RepID=A0A5B7DLM0_PORTR|nr:hypothetical protein [Portunus trituberculatus]